MSKLEKIVKIFLVSAGIGLAGFVAGKLSSVPEINLLRNSVESVQLQKNVLKQENYGLHMDLIKRGNPYGWELYGDGIGNWGYRKADETAILGTAGDGYNYLTNHTTNQ